VYGSSLKSVLVAIVVPEYEALREWAEQNKIEKLELPELCRNEDVKRTILSELTRLGKQAGLNGYEQVSTTTWSFPSLNC
jgi:long-chain acyl-CoA synthetase